jgi:hypothetical protein
MMRPMGTAADRCDLELMRSCYRPDGTDDHGSYNGGVDGFLEFVGPALQRFERAFEWRRTDPLPAAGSSFADAHTLGCVVPTTSSGTSSTEVACDQAASSRPGDERREVEHHEQRS